MMVSTQSAEVAIVFPAVRVDVVDVCCFLWATATCAVLSNPGAPVAVPFENAQPSLVPPAWEWLVSTTTHCWYYSS